MISAVWSSMITMQTTSPRLITLGVGLLKGAGTGAAPLKSVWESSGRRYQKTAFRTARPGRSSGLLGIVTRTGSGSIGECYETYPKAGPPSTRA